MQGADYTAVQRQGWAIRRRNGGVDASDRLLDDTATRDDWIPVVPADPAAVERVARSLKAEVKRSAEYYGLDNWTFEEVAEWVLRVAGETGPADA